MNKNDKIDEDSIDLSLLKDIPLNFSKGNRILPIEKNSKALKAAVSDIQGMFALNELAKDMGLVPEPVNVDSSELIDLINRSYGIRHDWLGRRSNGKYIG